MRVSVPELESKVPEQDICHTDEIVFLTRVFAVLVGKIALSSLPLVNKCNRGSSISGTFQY
jgi:hypothetical protein